MARKLHPEWYSGILGGGAETGGDLAPLRQTYAWAQGEAGKHPETLFVAVAGHTDSGDTPHFGTRWHGEESQKLSACLCQRLEGVWGLPPAFQWDSQGYIALPGEPENLISVILEEWVHTTPQAVLQWVGKCDAIARAIVEGVAEYVAGRGQPEWERRAREAEGRLEAVRVAGGW